ncbi:type II toxin-antitoxin system PemK/MazF family toxin [Niveispirillum sp.]|uniref:type II toxin-antitoxin system PemK/MazF family toxin n=1 Tax=Niveispirillum sp. TaxID=1917217 RepID=UPI001B62E870|nr:type II toxin-antitoxin system PemK/MazF family toxin [Niveispirillum sp.]MBP7338409.1 type II toxin-antitoxin system PemK/MazF family toxin [Niveispirillum sp.]
MEIKKYVGVALVNSALSQIEEIIYDQSVFDITKYLDNVFHVYSLSKSIPSDYKEIFLGISINPPNNLKYLSSASEFNNSYVQFFQPMRDALSKTLSSPKVENTPQKWDIWTIKGDKKLRLGKPRPAIVFGNKEDRYLVIPFYSSQKEAMRVPARYVVTGSITYNKMKLSQIGHDNISEISLDNFGKYLGVISKSDRDIIEYFIKNVRKK